MQRHDALSIESKRELLRDRLLTRVVKDEFDLPASSGQKALWAFAISHPESSAYHLKFTATIQPKIQLAVLENAIKKIIRRHSVLRSNYIFKGDKLVYKENHDFQFTLTNREIADNDLDSCILTDFVKPFNLQNDTLIRGYLYSTPSNQQVLLIVVHHIVADGLSLLIMLKEIGLILGLNRHNKVTELPQLKYDYKHYLRYHNNEIYKNKYQTCKSYWLNLLGDTNGRLSLPYDRTRIHSPSHEGGVTTTILDAKDVAELKSFAIRHHLTLHGLLLAVFQILLSSISGDKTVLCATPTHGRSKQEFLSLVGYFANMVVIRSDILSNDSLLSVLLKVKESLHAAIKHQSYPFSHLIADLDVQRDQSSLPLVQAAFAFHQPLASSEGMYIAESQSENGSMKWAESSVLPFRIGPVSCQFDLYLVVIESIDQTLNLSFEFMRDVFDLETIKEIKSHFVSILKAVVRNVDSSISSLEYYEPHRRFLNYIDNSYNQVIMPLVEYSLIDEILKSLHVNANHIAVTDGDREYTYQEIYELALGLAGEIRRVKSEQKIAIGIYLEKSVRQVVSVLAVLLSGNYFVPINIDTPNHRLQNIITTSDMELVITSELLAVNNSFDNVLTINAEYIDRNDANISCVSMPDDLVYVIYTSGTTGNPKGVAISQKSLLNTVLSINKLLSVNKSDSVLAVSDLSFDLAMYDIFGMLLAGGRIVFCKKNDYKNLDKYHVTTWNSVPMLFSMLLSQSKTTLGLKRVMLSGDWISTDLVRQGHQQCPEAKIFSLGGPTETTIWSIHYPLQRHVEYDYIPYGFPLPNQRYYVLNEDLEICRENQVGDIYAAGVGLARCYLNNDELTSKYFILHPELGRLYKTGDLGCMTKEYGIRIRGRSDRQVKIGGYRIELEDVRLALEKSFMDREVTCDTIGSVESRQIVAFIVSDSSIRGKFQVIENVTQDPDLAEGYQKLKKLLPEYMLPKVYVYIDHLPVNANGKIAYNALPNLSNITQLQSSRRLRTEFEKCVASIWSRVLICKIDELFSNSHFFHLGGDSLKGVAIISLVEKELGIVSDIQTLFDTATLSAYSEKLKLIQIDTLYRSSQFITLSECKEVGPIIVAVHPSTGTIDCYLNFSKTMSEDYQVVAIQHKPSQASSIPDLAKEYVEYILMKFPNRAINLVGYSLGGHIAFEMAKVFEKNSIVLESLAIFDVPPITNSGDIFLKSNISDNFFVQILIEDYAISRDNVDTYISYINKRQAELLPICQNYTTNGLVACRIGYFNATEASPHVISRDENCLGCWDVYSTHSVSNYSVPGNHMSIFSENNVQSLSEIYRIFLSKGSQ